MPGYNLQTYKNEFIDQTYRRGRDTRNPRDLDDAYIFELLNRAQDEIQAELEILKGRTQTDLTADTNAYSIPSGVTRRDLEKVEVLGRTGNGLSEVYPLSWKDFTDLYDIDNPSENSGTPKHYTLSTANQRQILLGPAPSYSRTNGLVIRGSTSPSTLFRVYQSDNAPDDTDITAAITKGTTAVALTIGGGTDPIDVYTEDGDEFGVIPTKQSDGQTVTNKSPLKWYSIDSMATPNITLGETFNQPTESTAKFITAQVSDLETAFKGGLGYLPVLVALRSHYLLESRELFNIYDALVIDQYNTLSPEFPMRREKTLAPKAGKTAFH